MQCRSCGTEIADKAIICFRCGAPTLDVSGGRQASDPARGREARWPARVAVVLAAGAVALAAFIVEDSGVRAGVVTGGAVLVAGLWWLLGRRGARRGPRGVH
ncbi:MAG TPA: hypothetical protein VLA20_04010 [Vicinamibacterales bacterium]|nr:hypothetical protein [Vicinamibacterales bacterium]